MSSDSKIPELPPRLCQTWDFEMVFSLPLSPLQGPFLPDPITIKYPLIMSLIPKESKTLYREI
jgi:hypothetical protein